MSFLVPNAGEIRMLRFVTGNTAPGTLTLRLYENNKTPEEGDTVSDYTEVSGYGYSAISLSGANWDFTTDGDGVSTATYNSAQTFTFTGGPVVIYGYYITDGGGNLVWVERFSVASVTIPAGGGEIEITPYLGLDSNGTS